MTLLKSGQPIDFITQVLNTRFKMTLTEEAVYMKAKRLGLEVVVSEKNQPTTTTCKESIPKELFTVEESLLILAKAMKALDQPDLPKVEIMRLRTLVIACKVYQDKFGEYVNYRRIEKELLELKEEVARLRGNGANDEKARA